MFPKVPQLIFCTALTTNTTKVHIMPLFVPVKLRSFGESRFLFFELLSYQALSRNYGDWRLENAASVLLGETPRLFSTETLSDAPPTHLPTHPTLSKHLFLVKEPFKAELRMKFHKLMKSQVLEVGRLYIVTINRAIGV